MPYLLQQIQQSMSSMSSWSDSRQYYKIANPLQSWWASLKHHQRFHSSNYVCAEVCRHIPMMVCLSCRGNAAGTATVCACIACKTWKAPQHKHKTTTRQCEGITTRPHWKTQAQNKTKITADTTPYEHNMTTQRHSTKARKYSTKAHTEERKQMTQKYTSTAARKQAY